MDFFKEMDNPASSAYNPNSYYEHFKHKGVSFAVSRDQSPDQSYLIPQIHKHPGVGTVTHSLFSINMKNWPAIILHTPCDPKLSTPSPGTFHIRKHLALERMNMSSSIPPNLEPRLANSKHPNWESASLHQDSKQLRTALVLTPTLNPIVCLQVQDTLFLPIGEGGLDLLLVKKDLRTSTGSQVKTLALTNTRSLQISVYTVT